MVESRSFGNYVEPARSASFFPLGRHPFEDPNSTGKRKKSSNRRDEYDTM
jgi:hypothetical protein